MKVVLLFCRVFSGPYMYLINQVYLDMERYPIILMSSLYGSAVLRNSAIYPFFDRKKMLKLELVFFSMIRTVIQRNK